MSRCDDKRITRKVVAEAGLNVPRGRTARRKGSDVELLHEIGEHVVKPACGEQGQGIHVGVTTEPELEDAIEMAGAHGTEERRVGKGCGRQGRTGGGPQIIKKKKN